MRYSVTILGVLLINYFLWQQAEVFFLGLYRPVEEVGFYTLASKIPSIVPVLIPAVLGTVLLPAIAEQFGRGDMDKIRRIYITSARYLMILSMPLAAGGIALARPIVNLLYGADYAPAIVLMQILFIPFASRAISYSADGVIQGIDQPSFIFKIGLVLTCLNIGLSLWLIPKYGVLGAAIASSVPRVLVLPIYSRFASKKIMAAWPVGDTVRIVLASLIIGLVLFALQLHLGAALSIVLGIPLGLFLYAGVILILRVIREPDLLILRDSQNSLPLPLRKSYNAALTFVWRFAGSRPPSR
jgi:O-antigen/teichoic acid export membrane protein